MMAKTYKREVAILALVLWFVAFFFTLYAAAFLGTAHIVVMKDLVIGSSFPCFGLVAGAFGLDAYSKQIQKDGREGPRG